MPQKLRLYCENVGGTQVTADALSLVFEFAAVTTRPTERDVARIPTGCRSTVEAEFG